MLGIIIAPPHGIEHNLATILALGALFYYSNLIVLELHHCF